MRFDRLMEQIVGVFALIVLVGGTLLVVSPFITALLWGALLTYSTWGLYMRLATVIGGRRTWGALLIVLIVLFMLLGPIFYAGFAFATHVDDVVAFVQQRFSHGLPAVPDWIAGIPLLGPRIVQAWTKFDLQNPELVTQLRDFAGFLTRTGFAAAVGVVHGLGLLALSVVFAFFFYLSGESVAAGLLAGMRRIAGERGSYILSLMGNTVRGVVNGILGTSLAQAVLSGLGYWIAGLPSPVILAFLTFFLAVIPGGPLVIVIPGAIWLAQNGETGLAVFLIVWLVMVGLAADNVLKPLLIGKSSPVPLILIMLGVLGGALAFGFLGLFIGPTLLAVTNAVLRDWALGEQIPHDPQTGAPIHQA